MLASVTWLEVEVIRLLSYKVTPLSPLPYCAFWKAVTIYSPNFRSGAPPSSLFKGTRDTTFLYIYIHLLQVGCFASIVSKGWQGAKLLSPWKAELAA